MVEQVPPAVDVVLPVYNEERALEPSIRRLRSYLDERVPFPVLVTIVDNASTDSTPDVAADLAGRVAGVRAIHLHRKGRGHALRAAWSASTAAVVAYMDVDLATDLEAFVPLVAPLLEGRADVGAGSRLAGGARVACGAKREILSRGYNAILRGVMHHRFSDAECGFKALTASAARELLPLVEDEAWFFDTELLILAEAAGLRIHEVPVTWVDDPDSRVEVVPTVAADLKGVLRMWRRMAGGPAGLLVTFWPARVLAVVAGYATLLLVRSPGATVTAEAGAGVLALAAATSATSVIRRDVASRRARQTSRPAVLELEPVS